MVSVVTRRDLVLSLLVIGFGPGLGMGSTATAGQASLAFMQGVWVGGPVRLSLDTERMLANLDPAKPFQWDPLIIRNISGGMVTFWVADRRFIGLFDGDQLSLAAEELGTTIRMERQPR